MKKFLRILAVFDVTAFAVGAIIALIALGRYLWVEYGSRLYEATINSGKFFDGLGFLSIVFLVLSCWLLSVIIAWYFIKWCAEGAKFE